MVSAQGLEASGLHRLPASRPCSLPAATVTAGLPGRYAECLPPGTHTPLLSVRVPLQDHQRLDIVKREGSGVLASHAGDAQV